MPENDRAAALRTRLERIARAEEHDPDDEPQAGADAAGRAILERAMLVETAIQEAIRQGKFDDLPGAGKPLRNLDVARDPDWWIRRKIETEQLTGLGPPALMLRVESAGLHDRLDGLHRAEEVRTTLEDFNARVIDARRQLLGGPPVVTPTRDVELEIALWTERRELRGEADRVKRELLEQRERAQSTDRRRRWFGGLFRR